MVSHSFSPPDHVEVERHELHMRTNAILSTPQMGAREAME